MRPTTLSKITCIVITALAAAAPLFAQQAEQKINPAIVPVPPQQKPIVQIAILLDTSNSMDGLIDQAKAQLWKVVNEFAKAQRGGLRPDIQVALYHYGTPTLGLENNYIKQLTPLTDDLDKVSEELFKLKTNGGDEFCGAVIQKATQDLKWSDDKTAYKAIFIAGNEPFTQGPIDVTYGQAGARGAANQLAQDSNAARAGRGAGGGGGGGAGMPAAAAVERSITKGGYSYTNGTWDLVDAVNAKKVDLKDVKEEDLPEDMRKLDAKGRADYLAQKAKERADIQAKIQQLAADREKFLAEKRNESSDDKTLDTAIIKAVRVQATNNGMSFESPK